MRNPKVFPKGLAPKLLDSERMDKIREQFGLEPGTKVRDLFNAQEQAELGILVSHASEQRVLAVLKHSPEITDRSGRAVGKLARFVAVSMNQGLARNVVKQLEAKKLVRTDHGSTNNPRRTYGVYLMVPPEDLHVDEWAEAEWRQAMEQRADGKAAKIDEAPADYDIPIHRRAQPKEQLEPDNPAHAERIELQKSDKQIIVNPTPDTDEMDYGKLADELLVKFMAKLNEPSKAKVIEKPVPVEDKALKQYAYELEQRNKAQAAQIEQMEKNIETLIAGAKDLQGQLDVAKARLRRYEEAEQAKSRNHRLVEALSPDSRAALESLKK